MWWKEQELKIKLNDSIHMKSTNSQNDPMVIEMRKWLVACVGVWLWQGWGELAGEGHQVLSRGIEMF